uniref:Cytochrome P450 6PZ29 n=1 Tax=Maconellicoccus hirsutus TaxID=177089 RepID=A0AAT9UTT0_MACHI
MSFYLWLILIVILLLIYFHRWLTKRYSYFEHLGIPYLKPNFLFGNLTDAFLLRKSISEVYADLYKKLDPYKYVGIFNTVAPAIMIRDPELLRHILIKDFHNFSDRGFHVNSEAEPMTNNLFFLKGDNWHNLRIKLTPTFSTGKMKKMLPLVKECATHLSQVLENLPSEESFDMKDFWARYMTDIVASCVFGIDANSLANPDSEFLAFGKKIFRFRFSTLLRITWQKMPSMLTKFITMGDVKTETFFCDIVYEMIRHREQSKIIRNDFLDLLISMKNDWTLHHPDDTKDYQDLHKFFQEIGRTGNGDDLRITEELLAAQAFVFFIAGFETTSTSLSYVLLELSLNPSIQDKVRQEFIEVMSLHGGEITYDVLKQTPYMDMVIAETLRKYPPVGMLQRRTCQDYNIPGSDVIIPEDTPIIISVHGIHMDEKYYENPQEFRPERFTEQEQSKRARFTYLPFGEGPRICIGSRFARLAMKVGLINALKKSSYQVSPRMRFPIKMDSALGLLTPRDAILLQRREIN